MQEHGHEQAHEHEHRHDREHGREHERRGHEKGPDVSKSLKYAHWIESPKDHESHHGESLATRNHEVIKHWAEERKATPATVPGTRHDDHLGVLRFDFPGYGGQQLEHVSWDEWFKTFDDRDLTFIFQETKSEGQQSNFFRLENPHREDA